MTNETIPNGIKYIIFFEVNKYCHKSINFEYLIKIFT